MHPAERVGRADLQRAARFDVPGAPYVLKATSAGTAGSFCCIETRVPPGSGVPSHVHAPEDEAFHVPAGEIVIDCADLDGPQRLGRGAFFFSPRGRQHGFRNESDTEARLLVFCLPGAGIETMFWQMDAAGRGGPPSTETIVAIAASAGVSFAPPEATPAPL